MLDGSNKDYVVYRFAFDRSGELFQCHKGLWAEWEEQNRTGIRVKMVDKVTMTEAWRFCELAKET